MQSEARFAQGTPEQQQALAASNEEARARAINQARLAEERKFQADLLAEKKQGAKAQAEVDKILALGQRNHARFDATSTNAELSALEKLRAEQQRIMDAGVRRSEFEVKSTNSATVAIERQTTALENQARIASARTPSERGEAQRAKGQTVIAGMQGNGASAEQIGRTASAYEKLAQGAEAAEIPLFQLSPVIGYQATAGLRLAQSLGGVASGMSITAVAASAAAIGVAALGIGIVAGANDLGNYAREMKNVSEETGLSLTGAQEFTRVTEMLGTRATSLAPAIQRLYRGRQ